MTLIDRVFSLKTDNLCQFNMHAITQVAAYLELPCRFEIASSFNVTSRSDDRLIDLVQAVGGTTYISGRGGQKYQHAEKFVAADIDLRICAYEPVPYPQMSCPPVQDGFIAGLSILDALFNLGPDARHLLTFRPLPEQQLLA